MRLATLLALAVLLASAPARADGTEGTYVGLRSDLRSLDADAGKRKLRHNWLALAKRFDRFVRAHPTSPRSCDARFLVAELYADMAGVSRIAADRNEAASRYRVTAKLCSGSRLADDALFRAADLAQRSDPSAARDDLVRLLARHADGDHAGAARKLLASLPAPPKLERRVERSKDTKEKEAPRRTGVIEKVSAWSRPAGEEIPLSVLAGLKVKRVVIDPGHGGNDTGAIGPGGTREKDVTLAIARKLQAELEGAGLEVVLTRDDDEYLELAERTKIANEKGGDLFVSIHCNANADRKLRGVETYTLNLNADRYAARLAARENVGSPRGIGELQMILADLATKANTDDSVRLARRVQSELASNMREEHGSAVRDLGVKQALFFVLIGAKMPAILVETSFLSNPEEEKILDSAEDQARIASSVAEGIRTFISDRDRLARGETPAGRGSGVF